MQVEEISIKKFNVLTNGHSINGFHHFVFLCILITLYFLYNFNYLLFHSLAEIYSCIIAGGILIISMSTYNVSKNNYFLFLGIGYMFILALDIFHTFTFGEIILSDQFVYDISTRFWIVARGLELVTYLIAFVFLFHPNMKLNFYIVSSVYFAVTSFLFVDITQLNQFIPAMRLETGMTEIKIFLEYIFAAGFVVCCLLLFKARRKMDKNLFVFLEISIICKIISELFFTKYMAASDFYNMTGHISKVISYYFLYMGVIVNGLQRPLDMIKNNLDIADNVLKEKEKQHRYMEEVIHQNEICYNWIVDNSGIGIVIARSKNIVYANETILNMLGARNIKDVAGRSIQDFLLDNSIDFNKISQEANTRNFKEMKILKINKDILDVEYTINDITYRGIPAKLILIKDLNLRKEINNLKSNLLENEIELHKSNEFNKVLTEFFSNISHDLKTPINVILSAVQFLLSKNKDGMTNDTQQLSKLLIIIKQNCYRLIRLIGNLIDTSKFESGFLKLELKNLNIVSVVEDITLSVGDYIRSKGVNIIFDTDVEEKIIAVDADKIERIMLNLLSNAVKFTNMGDEILVIIEDREDYVRISVKDTGVGIPDEKLKVIFDRFAQVDNTLIRNKEGSGIGLSLVKSLAEMHGGKIMVDSKLGEGSEFIVELPVKLTENSDVKHLNYYNSDNKIDKILIEFSDIYSID
ncbi:MAG: MASE3 domain-containing protein [Sedimentibacter sp.]